MRNIAALDVMGFKMGLFGSDGNDLNMYSKERGINPGSASVPVMVYVFPKIRMPFSSYNFKLNNLIKKDGVLLLYEVMCRVYMF